MNKYKLYFRLLRFDNWFKNVFIIPGILSACLTIHKVDAAILVRSFIAVLATCFIASANYTINEWLDRHFDKFHPKKKLRPSVGKNLNPVIVYAIYIITTGLGLSFGIIVGKKVFLTLLILLIMGIIYNVQPLRSKDRPILDVLSESINNPLRFLIGWWAVTNDLAIAPSSLLLSYWLGGAYLMNIKRFSEYKFLDNKEIASQYRASFKFYNEHILLVLSVFYAIASAIFGVVFLVKYKIELILTVPFVAGLYAWYLFIGLKKDSAAQHPELMYKEKYFILYTLVTICFLVICLFTNIPGLQVLLTKSFEFYP